MAAELQQQTQGIQDIEALFPIPTHTRGREFFTWLKKTTIFSDDQIYDNIDMKRTSFSTPKEEFSLERIYNEISNIRSDISEVKADIRNIKESLGSVPEMSKDIAVLKNEVSHINKNFDSLIGWVRGIGIGFILLLLGYFFNNILPLLSKLQQQ